MELYYTSKHNQSSISETDKSGYGGSEMDAGGYSASDADDWHQSYPSNYESVSPWYSQPSDHDTETHATYSVSGGLDKSDQGMGKQGSVWASPTRRVPTSSLAYSTAGNASYALGTRPTRAMASGMGHTESSALRMNASRVGGIRAGSPRVSAPPRTAGAYPPVRQSHAGTEAYAKQLLQQKLQMISDDSDSQYLDDDSHNYAEMEDTTSKWQNQSIHSSSAGGIRNPRIQNISPRSRMRAVQPRGWSEIRPTLGSRSAATNPRFSSSGATSRGTTSTRGTTSARGASTWRGATGARGGSLGPRASLSPSPKSSVAQGPQPLMGLITKPPVSKQQSQLQEGISAAEGPFSNRSVQGSSAVTATMTKEVEKKEEEEEEEDDDDDDDIDVSGCRICDIKFEKAQAYHIHLRSTSHHQKVEARKREKKGLKESGSSQSTADGASTAASAAADATKKGDHYCYVCNFPFSNAEVFNSHLQGLLHLQRLEEQKKGGKDFAANEEEEDDDEEDSHDSSLPTAFKQSGWVSASERDLNPDDIGKPGSSQYACEVCNITCTGVKSYEMHVVGAKHLKKLKKAQEIAEFEKKKKEGIVVDDLTAKPKKKKKCLRIQETLDQCSEPLIGLDYMTEFQLEDATVEPRYICDLCQSKMDMRQVIAHVTGVKHRHKYFKFHSIREFNILWDIRRKSEKVRAAQKFSAETEAREGRHKMRLRIQLTPFDDSFGATRAAGEPTKSGEDWIEVEDAHTRPRASLPGLSSFSDWTAQYKDVKDDEDEDDEDETDGPVLDVDELRSLPPRGQPTTGRGGPYQPPRPPYQPPRHGPPSRPPSRFAYPPRAEAPRHFPPERGYHRGQRAEGPQGAAPDPYYQRFPGYDRGRYDYYRPSFPSPSSSKLEMRAVINYDHQSLTKDEDGPPASYSGKESRAASSAGGSGERVKRTAADDDESAISSINTDLIKAAIGQCNIDTEADAEMALQISNLLTQALLEYRLNTLAKAGTSDPALEQHLQNLKEQNAELLSSGQMPETSSLMYNALKATKVLAAKIPTGNQETMKQAMSVLDAVNVQLYGMLDKSGDSAKPEEPQKPVPEHHRQRPVPEQHHQRPVPESHHQRPVPEQHHQKPVNQTTYNTYSDHSRREEESSWATRSSASSSSVRPPVKRFRLGL